MPCQEEGHPWGCCLYIATYLREAIQRKRTDGASLPTKRTHTHLRQHFFRNVDPGEAHDVGDEVQQELEGVVAQLAPSAAAAVSVEQKVTPGVQSEGVRRHARESHVSVTVLVPSRSFEDQPKRLSSRCARSCLFFCVVGRWRGIQ